ncbi:MAG: metal-dependent hydrolase [Deltaproteobacteria bacterium]|nr:metal-dependent hydrolase [Deltaproteobacteria bacterium]
MPNFLFHLGASAVTSAVTVAAIDATLGLGNTASTLAFLAGVSGGLLPDLDSDQSHPLRLSGLAAGFGAAGAVYGLAESGGPFPIGPPDPLNAWLLAFGAFLLFNTLVVRFLRKHTVHRGLFHSLAVPFLYAGVWAIAVSGLGRKTVFAVWTLAALGVMTHLVLDAAKSLSPNPLKLATKDIAASTRLWLVTALVNLLALANPFAVY